MHDDDPGGRAPEVEVPREERDHLLGRAEVLVIGYPVPRSIAGRAPRLRWAHHTQAGVSNLVRSDLWSSTVTLTSGRGTVSARAIAEYAIAAVLFSARGLDEASRQKHEGRFTRRGYRMRTVSGSTIGIVGLGGIGREVGRMAQTLGLRVLATRASVEAPEHDVDGADLVLPADQLLDVAAQSDFLAVCSQLTERTRRMIDGSVFAAMPTHAVLVNIARGEEVDEDALLDALEHEQIAGAVLDVQAGRARRRHPPFRAGSTIPTDPADAPPLGNGRRHRRRTGPGPGRRQPAPLPRRRADAQRQVDPGPGLLSLARGRRGGPHRGPS